ncbi:hypothetical protein M422DRAFT_270834 [Sphaerobolus stellatus SS14]|uniref:Uncharacterized protein n=1 Tax=Sphaerobolus stellatus (strain SS14) TaxID=990650 RepID=A0A0C9UG84_SPHS4|nr:hypothetical protein M422DRAFT_270834 [Sphaerobolus stellatus SS14]
MALLQPRPHLEHLFPHRPNSRSRRAHDLPHVTYVGKIGNSLYAMGHENFPLVVFDNTQPLSIPEGETDGEVDIPCRGIECLIGARSMEKVDQWGMPPLLEGCVL